MELCNCSTRDIFDYTEDPLLEKEIALIAKETLKVTIYFLPSFNKFVFALYNVKKIKYF